MLHPPGLRAKLPRMAAAVALIGALTLSSLPTSTKAAQEDWGIDGGWFYTQTRGEQPDGTGFAVIDTANIPFWSEYQRVGGPDVLGYPVSHRFVWDGAVSQAFQRGVLQWNGEGVQIANVYNNLSASGLDEWLMSTYAVPRAESGAGLSESGAIAQVYDSIPNGLAVLGAPVSYKDFGPVATLRTERAAIQQWKVETSFAPVGGIVIPNAGDVLVASGVVPVDAAKAAQVNYVGGYGGYYPYGGVQAPRPLYYYPYYPYYHPPVVQSAPYYPYYPANYNYGNWYRPNYGYGYGYQRPMSYPYYPYAPYAPNYYPSSPYGYGHYGYGYGYGAPYYGALPQQAVCQGDEQMSFNPGRPGTNQRFTIEVTSARPHQPFELRGPGNPQFAGVRGGGKGYIWSWTAQIGNNGRYNFDFVVYSGTVCTANVVEIG